MIFKLALRGLLRNTRRSLMTLGTVVIGTVAALVFGAYVVYILLALQSSTVQRGGHLRVFRTGYYLYGAGNPSAYGIEGYETLLTLIREDPVVKPLLTIATPVQAITGIAGNAANDTSKPFFGQGFIPSDRIKMGRWDDFLLGVYSSQSLGLRDEDPSQGVIGIGLGRILGYCDQLKIENRPRPPDVRDGGGAGGVKQPGDAPALPPRDRSPASPGGPVHLDLLGASAGGAPNIVTLTVIGAQDQGGKEADDSYVGMHLKLAQQLLYGRDTPKVSAIALQLRRTQDLPLVRQRLVSLFAERNLDLEVRDFEELNPFYTQVVNVFTFIFGFISIIIGIVVLFTVTNTVGMSVMERTTEVGMVRALGVRRAGVRWQFLVEGWLMGLIGATVGVVLAATIVWVVNHSGLTWMPPGNAKPTPFTLVLFARKSLVIGTWIGIVVVATVSAYLPASRASKLPIVDALRHV